MPRNNCLFLVKLKGYNINIEAVFCAETFEFTFLLLVSMSIAKVVSEEKINLG